MPHANSYKRKPYPCTYCGKLQSLHGNLQIHIRIQTPYQCQYCSCRFSDSGKLNLHLLIHTGEKPYQCKYKFRYDNSLHYHQQLHTGEKPYQSVSIFPRHLHCEFCTKQSFKMHTGDTYKCQYCG